MGEPNTTNQDTYKNRQRFNGKIRDLYKSFIKPNAPKQRGIDDYRSKTSIKGQTAGDVDAAIMNNTLRQLLKSEQTYQESRCHAFYRMIGFPVYDGENFYNPGLDHIEKAPDDSEKTLSTQKKNKIASNTIIGIKELGQFVKLSDAREAIPIDFLKVFELNDSITSSTLALSGVKQRKFVAPLENVDAPVCLDKLKSSYEVNQIGQIGNNKILLSAYIDGNGMMPQIEFLKKRSHIIAPFLVDPRYSESVNVNNMPSVPFVLTEKQLKASETVTVEAPLLETIIVNRLTGNNLAGTSGQLEEITKYIQNDPSITDSKLVKTITTGYKLTEQQQFLEYINIMKSMLAELIQAQKAIDKVQKNYYWLPIPSKTGPEGGVSVRPTILSEKLVEKVVFITEIDYQHIIAELNKLSNQSAASIGYASVKRRPVFPLAATIFNPNVNDSAGDNIVDNFKELTKIRDLAMKQAGDALQIIEMIMGEFSGLGLCDILAIIASLYIMPIDKLLGFLDEDAFIRMKAALNIKSIEREKVLDNSLQELTDRVRDFYTLMDKLYEDLRKHNGLI